MEIAKALGCSCDYLLIGGDLPAGLAIPPSLTQFAANRGLSFKQVEVLMGMHRQVLAFDPSAKASEPDWSRLYALLREYLGHEKPMRK